MLLRVQHRSQPVDAGFVDPFRGKRGRQGLEYQARVEQVVQGRAQVLEIDDDGAGHGTGVGLTDQQPAVRSGAHPGDLVVLDEADGLPQHRSTHAKALLQSLFGAQRFADGPAAADDVRLNLAGNLRSQLFRSADLRRTRLCHKLSQHVSNMHPATGPPPTETTPTSGRSATWR